MGRELSASGTGQKMFQALGDSMWGHGGVLMGLALSAVKDFRLDPYSGEHPRGSSVTDRFGLVFGKDPGGCWVKGNGCMRCGYRSSREASWVLHPPSLSWPHSHLQHEGGGLEEPHLPRTSACQ
jgi:hypothetical protein